MIRHTSHVHYVQQAQCAHKHTHTNTYIHFHYGVRMMCKVIWSYILFTALPAAQSDSLCVSSGSLLLPSDKKSVTGQLIII